MIPLRLVPLDRNFYDETIGLDKILGKSTSVIPRIIILKGGTTSFTADPL